jgi:hypothetical protein
MRRVKRSDLCDAEIASIPTVLFAAGELKDQLRLSETAVLDVAMHWKQKRRPPLDRGTVASTIRNLAALKWLTVTPDPSLPVLEAISA